MSKKVVGQRSDTMLARSILRNVSEDQVMVQEVDGEASVYVSNAYFEFKSRSENFEPYLVLQCHMNSISGDFAGDINEIVFNDDESNIHPATAPQCQFEYYPSKDEHCDMIMAGMYDRMDEEDVRLKPGNILFGAILLLPTKVKVYHVQPLSEEDSPITFVEVENKFNIPIDALSSGYANEEEYNNGRIVGLLGKEYLDPVPTVESEYVDTTEFDHVMSLSDEEYIQQHDDYEIEEETPVEEIPLSEEDKAMLDKYVSIQEAADKRLEEMENNRAERLAAKQAEDTTEVESEEPVDEESVDESASFGKTDKDGFMTFDDEPTAPSVRQMPDGMDDIGTSSDDDEYSPAE